MSSEQSNKSVSWVKHGNSCEAWYPVTSEQVDEMYEIERLLTEKPKGNERNK